MKKLLFGSVFISISILAFSQDILPPPPPPSSVKIVSPSPSKIAASKKLLEATGGAKMEAAVLESMFNSYKASGITVDEALLEEAKKEAR